MIQPSIRRLLSIGLAFSFCVLTQQGAAESPSSSGPLKPESFAQAMPLVVDQSRPIHTLILPDEIYRGSVRPNFADVRIFNHNGVAVPHAIRSFFNSVARIETENTLPFFPLHAQSLQTDGTGFSFSAETRQDGTIENVTVRVDPREDNKDNPKKKVIAFLVDASQLTAPIHALTLTFEVQQEQRSSNFVAQMSVDASDNLTDFRAVAPPQAIAYLTYGGETVQRTRLELPGVSSRYLRLSWTGRLPGKLVSLRAQSGKKEAHENLVSMTVSGTPDPSTGGFLYDLHGLLPVNRIRVLLGEDNLLIRAKVEAADAKGGPYSLVDSGTYFRVKHEGTLIESPPRQVTRRNAAYLRVSTQRPGGSFGARAPLLEITRQADQLLFAERGPGPFQLVFGHYSAPNSAFSVDDLLTPLPAVARETLSLSDTEVGAMREVAGASALRAPPPPFPWKKFVLWAVLVGSVLALGAAALSLLRTHERTKAE